MGAVYFARGVLGALVGRLRLFFGPEGLAQFRE